MKKRYQKIHINKVQSEPVDFPVSVDLNSNNSNLNSGPNCALFQLKSTCPLFGPKTDVSALPTKNRWESILLKQLATVFTMQYILYHFEIFMNFINVLIKYCCVFLPEIMVRSTRGITLFYKVPHFLLNENVLEPHDAIDNVIDTLISRIDDYISSRYHTFLLSIIPPNHSAYL